MGRALAVLLVVLLVLGLVFAGYALSGWILMLLWNWLVPSLFAGPVITFWQGVGIIFLLSLIGGALGIGKGKRS